MHKFIKLFKKTKVLVVLTVLALSAGAVLAYANINSVYFSLAGWDGPMYIDVNAYCPASAKIETYNTVTGEFDRYTRGSLNGNWRVFTDMKPRQTYNVGIYCFDGQTNHSGDARYYNVYFNGASISVW